MKVTLTLEADELKIVQLLAKLAEKYRVSYSLNRQAKGYLLKVELNSEDFGEFIRRMNHLKYTAAVCWINSMLAQQEPTLTL